MWSMKPPSAFGLPLSAPHPLHRWCSRRASRQPAAASQPGGLHLAADEPLLGAKANAVWAAACLRMCRFAAAASETAAADAQVTGQLLTRAVSASVAVQGIELTGPAVHVSSAWGGRRNGKRCRNQLLYAPWMMPSHERVRSCSAVLVVIPSMSLDIHLCFLHPCFQAQCAEEANSALEATGDCGIRSLDAVGCTNRHPRSTPF